jgi:amino acid adenylation domain-containing protein
LRLLKMPDFVNPFRTTPAHHLDLNRVALSFEGQELDYGTLEQRAAMLAHKICSLSLDNADELGRPSIGVSLQRGPEIFVAILACLKAGCVVVPIDPAHSDDYKRSLVSTAQCDLLICDQPTNWTDILTHSIESLSDSTDIDGALASPMGPDDVGFVLFTSGTTGQPKGVKLGLAAILMATEEFGSHTGMCQNSVIAQFTGLSFDSAILEFLQAYLHGAQLAIVPEAARLAPEELATFLTTHKVTHLTLPAAIAPYLPRRDEYALEALICVGDKLDDQLFWDWADICPTFNGYGPTEASVCASLCKVEPGKPISLGAPLKHVEFAQDPDSKELLIGGFGLAKGYMGDPTQTARRFVKGDDGAVWYFTGDEVTLAADGQFRFVGRTDFQTKIRGARVETSAVEAVLAQQENVREAAVIAVGNNSSDRHLVAFVVADSPKSDLLDQLKEELKRQLPESHFPKHFKFLERLPYTLNHKVDRKALAALCPSAAADGLAGDDLESCARAAFLQELGRDQVDMDQDFFQLGGDSVGAMRLLAKLSTLTDRKVAVGDFRKSPTLGALIELLNRDAADIVQIELHQRDTDVLPLSPQQNAAWYMFNQDPSSKAYLAEAVHHFEGEFDAEAMQKAAQKVFDRHEIYRTVFFEDQGEPVQQILPHHQVEYPIIDATQIAANAREDFIKRTFADALPGIFDLGELPLARFALIKFSDHDYALLHQEHHIVHDGWGGSEFTAELMNWYHHFASPDFHFAPAEVPQYADFLIAQTKWLATPEAAAQKNYWVEQLADAPRAVPIFGKKSTRLGFEGGYERIDFTRDEWIKCEKICREMGVTPFGFTSAVLNLMLWQYSGEKDIVFGAPFANRNWVNSQAILGMLVNTLVLRTHIDPSQNAHAFICETQKTIDAAYANQEMPFGAVVEALNPERFGGQNPLFNVLLGFHDAPIEVEEMDGLRWRKDETVISKTTKFDLDCLVVNRDKHFTDNDMVTFLWEYRSDIYDASEIRHFVESFRQVFLSLCESQDMAISDVPSLTGEQSDILLFDWGNGYDVPASVRAQLDGKSFIEALTEPLQSKGEQIALRAGNEVMSYRQLDDRSDALAAAIQNQVQPNDRVAIYAARGMAQIVAMVATQKLQATIVCLDPSLPEARIEHMLEDSAPVLVLWDKEKPPHAPSFNSFEIGTAPAGKGFEPRKAQDGHLAYVNYTSGSTGQPKGVEIFASSLLDECAHLMSIMSLTSQSRGVSLSHTGFDAYHGEVWPLLLAGGSISLIADGERDDLNRLMQLMHDQQISVACLPTGLLEEAINGGADWPDSLKVLAAGGDRLSAVQLPDGCSAKLLNLYGPTETTIDATYYEVPHHAHEAPPIGRPAAYTSAYVMDGDRLCPIGAPGELVIGGSGVAKGYRNLPDETTKSFVQFASWPHERFYRTGDKVRWRHDGQLEFLGRIDDEIQLRGYRIAPAEIVSNLQRHANVAQAAVAVKNGALCAYVTLAAGNRDEDGDSHLTRNLKAQLTKVLPHYMVPNRIVVLERLPLTPQGKVNVKALPDISGTQTLFKAPQSPTEKTLHAQWLEVLNIEKLSVTDNFFAVGGHSLLAIRLMGRIRDELNVELRVNDFFDHATVQDLAEYIDLLRDALAEPEADYQFDGEF